MKNVSDKIKINGFFPDKVFILNVFFLFVFILITLPTLVDARIMVSPTRLTFEKGQRSATVWLMNKEDKQIAYRIRLIQSRMTEEGNLKTIEAPADREKRLAEKMALDLIRYSPRQVTLPPNMTQLVRLQLRMPVDLEEGEYRSRLLFQEIPAQLKTTGDIPEGESKTSLRVIYGISIPIIIRHGETWAEARLSDLQLEYGKGMDHPELVLKIRRSGNSSVYGDIEVTYIPDEGEKKSVGIIKGIAVYTEVEEMKLRLRLNKADSIDFKKGHLYVTYRRPAEAGGQLIAARDLEL